MHGRERYDFAKNHVSREVGGLELNELQQLYFYSLHQGVYYRFSNMYSVLVNVTKAAKAMWGNAPETRYKVDIVISALNEIREWNTDINGNSTLTVNIRDFASGISDSRVDPRYVIITGVEKHNDKINLHLDSNETISLAPGRYRVVVMDQSIFTIDGDYTEVYRCEFYKSEHHQELIIHYGKFAIADALNVLRYLVKLPVGNKIASLPTVGMCANTRPGEMVEIPFAKSKDEEPFFGTQISIKFLMESVYDLNGNSVVDMSDALLILRSLVGLRTQEEGPLRVPPILHSPS